MPQLPLGFLFPPISEVVRFGGQDFTKKNKEGRKNRKETGREEGKAQLLSATDLVV